MTKIDQRRHKLTASLPESVRPLPEDHPAIRESRPLFTHRIISAANTPRLLVSGYNSKKIGTQVTLGPWAGMPIFTLTLAERITCPSSCHAWRYCYGNAMQWPRRHLPGPELEARLREEIKAHARKFPDGFVVRIHVLGDFYSAEYAQLWYDLLAETPELRAWGYTAVGTSDEPSHKAIASIIAAINNDFPDRCVIRFSFPKEAFEGKSFYGGATLLMSEPESGRAYLREDHSAIVCPAEREKDMCCATCGLCWAPQLVEETIAFVLHGKGSSQAEKIARDMSVVGEDGTRPIRPISHLAGEAGKITSKPPIVDEVLPDELLVDGVYQRDLSKRSVNLIRKIIQEWDWTKFKPPIVCQAGDGYFVLDGQHTAIAALTHPDVDRIPVLVVEAPTIKSRASSFVGHNKNRIAVTALQIHHSLVAAGDEAAKRIEDVCAGAGVEIMRAPPPGQAYKPGETMALGAIQFSLKRLGDHSTTLILRALSEAERAPLRAEEIRACVAAILDGYAIEDIKALAREVNFKEISDLSAELAIILNTTKPKGFVAAYQRLLAEREEMDALTS